MNIKTNKKESESIFFCPYPDCKIGIEIIEINCAIFRCGIYKHNGAQIEPHLPKEKCDLLKDKIWGCGRPFQYIDGSLVPCDYL
jgi:hypothetical protein